MKKSLIILFTALLATFWAKADITANWKLHMNFDSWATSVIETPSRVYFMGRTFENNPSVAERSMASNALYYYDKEGDEIVPVNKGTIANGNAVACINYNSKKKYLLVVYTDCNIDFIYDDGRIFNVPALQIASIPGKKEANYITFDHHYNRAYIATTFGYISLNDIKHEVAESRNYDKDVQSVARCAENIVLCIDNNIYFAPLSDKRFNIDEYTIIPDAPPISRIIPSYSSHFFGYTNEKNSSFTCFHWEDDHYTPETWYYDTQFYGIQQIEEGHQLTGALKMYYIHPYGEVKREERPLSDYGRPAASYNGNEFWSLTNRQGLRSVKKTGDSWAVSRDYMRPNSPATYVASSAVYHPTYGMLVGSNGYDVALTEFSQSTPNNISALKGNFWKEYGTPYTHPDLIKDNNYTGLSIDPLNTNYVYRAGVFGGLMRVNLSNPEDILIFAHPGNPNANLPIFVKIVDSLDVWNILCPFTPPQFASDGTMWTAYNNEDAERTELWYWTAADRAATTSAATYRPMKKLPVPKYKNTNSDKMIALQKTKNILVLGSYGDGGSVLLYDHNGTPDKTSDDRYAYINDPYDQDGGSVSFLNINALAEDPQTGMLWIMSQRGLFTVNPATVFENPNVVNRIKVARNDGTNLADYLLNEINVNHMSIDGEGRKWFSTSNGLVCTSADGRTILGEFTTENSLLPDDNVFATCYNPENKSMIVATNGGIVEMFPSGSGGGDASAEGTSFRAYPNPVEPDYYGWVRIDNLADGSLVKITDAKGGIVKELGPVNGGSVQWDVSGLNNTRVSTGVYYIMVSPPASGGKTEVSKILVLN